MENNNATACQIVLIIVKRIIENEVVTSQSLPLRIISSVGSAIFEKNLKMCSKIN